jgi:hypothetical protein
MHSPVPEKRATSTRSSLASKIDSSIWKENVAVGVGRMSDVRSQLVGAFTGYNDGAIFRLANGQTWQQRRYKYKYQYRPQVRIYQDQNRWLAEFDCMDEPIEVVRVHVVEEGTIVSDFNGFDGNSRFEFESGRVWAQAEYRYSYHYAFRPRALVVDGVNGVVLQVEGMSEYVRVRPA